MIFKFYLRILHGLGNKSAAMFIYEFDVLVSACDLSAINSNLEVWINFQDFGARCIVV